MSRKTIKNSIIIFLFVFAALNLIGSYTMLFDYVVPGPFETVSDYDMIKYNSYVVQLIEAMAIFVVTFMVLLNNLRDYDLLETYRQWMEKKK